jgi:hypothetical protein
VSNPLDHYRRFLVTFPSSFSGLCLTLAQFDCQKAPYGVIMGCGGREVVHYSGFHISISYAGGFDTEDGSTLVRRACIGSVLSRPTTGLSALAPAQRAIAQRFSALARSCQSGMSAVWSLSGVNRTCLERPDSVAIDPDRK